jgi:GAF domain-containing protein/HAMP domain-containing protein
MKQSPSSGGMKQSPSSGGRSVTLPQPSDVSEGQPSTAGAAQRAQRTALVVFAVTLALTALAAFQWWTSAQWQLGVVTASLAAYAVGALVAWRQFGAGRPTRGGWILITGLYLVFPINVLLTEGTGLVFALCLITLTVMLASVTLPATQAARAIVIALVPSLLTLILGVITIPGRIQVAEANAVMPFLTAGILIVLAAIAIRGFSAFTLRTKLIVVSLTVSLIPVGLIGIVFAVNAQENATASAKQTLQAAGQKAAASLDEFLQGNLNDIRVASQLPEFQALLALNLNDANYDTTLAQAEAAMRALSRRDPIFLSSYALLDKDGFTVLDTYRPDIGVNKVDRDWFVKPIADKLPYVSQVSYSASTNRPSIYFSSPVRDSQGNVQGVLRARFDAAILQERIFLNNGLAGSESGAMLVDENNIKLADGLKPDSVTKIVGQPSTNALTILKSERRLPDLPVEELSISAPELESGLANAAQQPFFVAELEQDPDKEQMVVESMSTQPWKVVFSRPQQQFLAPVANQTRLILLSGLLIVLAIVSVAALAAQVISRPVVALTETAHKVQQGDLNAQAQVMTQDEIGTLATTFNSMTFQLREVVTSLEDRVQSRTDQLRASAEVGRVATSILNSDQLLEQVANLITTRFGFYYTAVFTLDEPGQFALLRAATGEAGRILLERHHRLPVNLNSMVGAAIITQRPRIALDVGEGAVRFANPLLPNTRSEISLPLRVGERVIGALNVQSEEAGAFDEARAEVLQAMADQIAVALFNAETFARSEKQALALTRLNQLSRELAQATTRESVAVAVAQAVVDLIGENRLALVETTPNPELLAARTLWPDVNRSLGDPIPVSISRSLSGDCLQRGERIYVPDTSTVLEKYEDVALIHARGVRSSVAIPLRLGERILGTFNVASDQMNAYHLEQLNQLEQVAAQVAVTLDSLNLAKQTQEALSELDAANRRLMGQAWSTYTQAGGLVAAEWRNGEWITTHKQGRRVEPVPSQALVTTQAINLPIKVRGATIGEFSVAPDAGQVDWNPEEVAFAQALIDQVGQVLENARLLEETERLAQREKAVADAADKIHRSTDIEAVLHSAISELNRITGRRGISIQLGFGGTETQRSQPAGNGPSTASEGDR